MHHRVVQQFVTLMALALALAGVGCTDVGGPSGDLVTGEFSETATAGVGEVAGSGTAGVGAAGVDGSAAGTTAIGGASGEGGAAGSGEFAGSGGVGGDVAGMGGSAGTGSEPKPKCLQKDSQVVVLGDSYINWVSHTMPQDLKTVSNQSWRMYAIGAASMGSGGASFIPDQLDTAIKEDPDMVAGVMTGGGNDILVPSADIPGAAECKNRADAPTLPACQMVVDLAIDTAIELMDDAAAAGIKDVVYFFYPEVPEGTLIGGTHPRAMLNYALPKVRETCEGAEVRTGGKLKCHFIDTIPLFKGHDDWFAPTDIHENSLGSMAIAKEIWSVMQTNCIAQKAPNACCEP